jgi:MOSC domain-containing protein YiiM
VLLRRTGLEGDAQGDMLRHGGPEKAVHHYPFDHYVEWKSEIGPNALLDQPGASGENVSTAGLTEADVAIGDIFRLGRALIQVSQGRQPCWKLNERFADARMARRVQDSGRTGWYYRVLEEGVAVPGDLLALVERVSEDWTIRRVWHYFYVDTMNADALRQIAALPSLARGWRDHAAKRLATRAVEDWGTRLEGSVPPHPPS